MRSVNHVGTVLIQGMKLGELGVMLYALRVNMEIVDHGFQVVLLKAVICVKQIPTKLLKAVDHALRVILDMIQKKKVALLVAHKHVLLDNTMRTHTRNAQTVPLIHINLVLET